MDTKQQSAALSTDILSHQIKTALEGNLPTGHRLITRKEFLTCLLKSRLKETAHSAEAAVLAVPLGVNVMLNQLARQTPEERLATEKKMMRANDKHIRTSLFSTFPNQSRLHNVGVTHAGAFLEPAALKEMAAIVKAADIILMETELVMNSDRHILIKDSYFGTWREMALKAGKELYDIDVKQPKAIERLNFAAPLTAAICLGLLNAHKLLKRLPEMNLSLRKFIRTLGWSAAAISPFASPQFMATVASSRSYPVTDLSYVIDARTVFMYKHIKEISSKNPGKKLLVVSGDLHARGFEYYREHPKVFQTKLALYEATYEPHLSGPPERVYEPYVARSKPKK